MIVTNTESGWEIILQPAHSLLAGQLADFLNSKFASAFWPYTRTAIAMHDNEAEDFRNKADCCLTEIGTLRDFTQFSMSDSDRLTTTEREIEIARMVLNL